MFEACFIRPMMIPQSSWGKNLRSVLSKDNWDKIRKTVYAASGRRCRICGGRGEKWPVEADELWSYDDTNQIQKLVNIIAVCPTCHKIHHWGKTTVSGETEIAIKQMMLVNGWTYKQSEDAGDEGFNEWERRSKKMWKIDYSWALKRFKVSLEMNAEELAQSANSNLVAIAGERFEQSKVNE